MAKEEKTCVIYEVESALEGQILEDLLQEAGIPAMVSPTQDSVFDGYEKSQKGWGRVIVLTDDKPEAERVLQEYLAAREEPAKKKAAKKKRPG